MLGVSGLIAVTIPDIPTGIKVQIQRERLLEREIMFESPSDKAKLAKENDRHNEGGGGGGGEHPGLVHRRNRTADSQAAGGSRHQVEEYSGQRRDSKMYLGADEEEDVI